MCWPPLCVAQTLWRSKLARRELRKRRTEAREAGKLMQDKQVLEVKVKELQGLLEMVQKQRNELKQQFRVRQSRSGRGTRPTPCGRCVCEQR